MGENETKWVGGRERSVALLPPEEGMPNTDPDQVMPQEFIPVWQKGVSRERGDKTAYIVSRITCISQHTLVPRSSMRVQCISTPRRRECGQFVFSPRREKDALGGLRVESPPTQKLRSLGNGRLLRTKQAGGRRSCCSIIQNLI